MNTTEETGAVLWTRDYEFQARPKVDDAAHVADVLRQLDDRALEALMANDGELLREIADAILRERALAAALVREMEEAREAVGRAERELAAAEGQLKQARRNGRTSQLGDAEDRHHAAREALAAKRATFKGLEKAVANA
jgi:phage shock protein A